MIVISKDHWTRICQHARETYPFECCGIITGDRAGDVLFVHRCTNIQERLHRENPEEFSRDARVGYYVDPQEQFKIISGAEEEGLEVRGFYHSHPDSGAYFSEEDQERAMFFDEPGYPDAFHIVVSVMGGEARDAKAFKWDGARSAFVSCELKTTGCVR